MTWNRHALAIVVLVLLAGCGQQTPTEPDPPGRGTMLDLQPDMIAGSPGHRMPGMNDPVIAIRMTLNAIQKGKLEQAYDFLPVTYQQEIDGLLQTFANRMDPDLWNELFVVLRKGIEVLKTKRELVLPLVQQFTLGPRGNEPRAAERLDANWDGLVSALDVIVQSEVSDIDRLKRASLRQFLATTGNRLFAQVQALDAAGSRQLSDLNDVVIERVLDDPGRAILSIQWPNDPQPIDHEFTIVDSRWLPLALAQQWPHTIQSIQDELDKMTPDQFAAIKPDAMMHLKGMQTALDAMRNANRAEEFFGAILPLKQSVDGLQHALTLKAAPPGSIVITLDRELPEPEETKLLDDLVRLTDNPDRATFTAVKGSGRTRISLSHVKSVAAFADKMTFASSKTVNLDGRSIAIELK